MAQYVMARRVHTFPAENDRAAFDEAVRRFGPLFQWASQGFMFCKVLDVPAILEGGASSTESDTLSLKLGPRVVAGTDHPPAPNPPEREGDRTQLPLDSMLEGHNATNVPDRDVGHGEDWDGVMGNSQGREGRSTQVPGRGLGPSAPNQKTGY